MEAFNLVKIAALKFSDLLNAMKKLKTVESYFHEMNHWAQEFPTSNDYYGAIGGIGKGNKNVFFSNHQMALRSIFFKSRQMAMILKNLVK